MFTISLLRAIEAKKRDIVTKKELTQQEERQIQFLRNRGATFMLTAAVGACVETFLSKAVPNRFRLSFGPVSPDTAITYWKPIIEATIPFCAQLQKAVETGLKNRDEIAAGSRDFQSMVEATKAGNSAVYEQFRKRVILQ